MLEGPVGGTSMGLSYRAPRGSVSQARACSSSRSRMRMVSRTLISTSRIREPLELYMSLRVLKEFLCHIRIFLLVLRQAGALSR